MPNLPLFTLILPFITTFYQYTIRSSFSYKLLNNNLLDYGLTLKIPTRIHSVETHINSPESYTKCVESKVDYVEKYLITSPLFYLNGEPHLGHAYTLVASDVLKRFLLLKGAEAKLLVGTDEHGSKIESSSKKLGISPKEFVLERRKRFTELYKVLEISPDFVVHTSEEVHKTRVESIFDHLLSSKMVYRGLHKGFFSPKEDLYYPESKIKEGKSPLGFEVFQVEEPAYFFDVNRWKGKILEALNNNPEIISPNHRLKEVKQMLENTLGDIAISRSKCNWGIPLAPSETIYVWFDALVGYLSHYPPQTTSHAESHSNLQGYNDIQSVENTLSSSVSEDKVKVIQIMGKDILFFHTMLWFPMLFSLGLELPNRLLVHGWLLNQGEKLSKSLGNANSALETGYSSDVLRFGLMSLGDFSFDFELHPSLFPNSLKTLRNKFANTLHRVTSILHSKILTNSDPEVNKSIEKLELLASKAHEMVNQFRLDKYLQTLIDMSGEITKFIEGEKLWDIDPSSPKISQISWTCCSLLLYLSLYLTPIVPKLAKEMISRLNPSLNGNPVSSLTFKDLSKINQFSFKPVHTSHLI